MKEGMKILVAYDGSTHARHALSEAVEIAKRFSGSVTLLHVYMLEPADVNRTLKDIIREKSEAGLKMIRDVEGDLKKAGVAHDFISVHSDNIPETIIRTANDGSYDLIAIGSRGFGEVRALLLSSVSHRIIAEAHCDVLVTK